MYFGANYETNSKAFIFQRRLSDKQAAAGSPEKNRILLRISRNLSEHNKGIGVRPNGTLAWNCEANAVRNPGIYVITLFRRRNTYGYIHEMLSYNDTYICSGLTGS